MTVYVIVCHQHNYPSEVVCVCSNEQKAEQRKKELENSSYTEKYEVIEKIIDEGV